MLLLSCKEQPLTNSASCTVNNCYGVFVDNVCRIEKRAEDCNGIDDDCDGVADPVRGDCNTACGSGVRACSGGRWGVCTAPEPGIEVCDGKDNDCDGLVDNIASVACYSASPNTAALGVCHGGSQRCVGGMLSCFGEVTPKAEECNGLDDDCDGQIDEGLAQDDIEVVFIVDMSVSMTTYMGDIQTATNEYTGRNALVVAPTLDYDFYPAVYADFPDGAQRFYGVSKFSGGNEPVLDALYYVENGQMALSYSNRRRVIVAFTDEAPQSYGGTTVTTNQLKGTSYIFVTSFVRNVWQSAGILKQLESVRSQLPDVLRTERCK